MMETRTPAEIAHHIVARFTARTQSLAMLLARIDAIMPADYDNYLNASITLPVSEWHAIRHDIQMLENIVDEIPPGT